MPAERVSVIPLDLVGAGDAGRVGSKAANLGELKRAGLPVPHGFVVVGEPGQDLAPAVSALGDGPVAVRSSALAEDLAEASFAGLYETVLNVRGFEQVRDAIRHCRSSASTGRVESYRAGRAEEAGDEMAVLVQRMVAADAAGVAFTANPVTGDRHEVLISAVRGLGERLVSGEASAEEWVVRSGKPLRRRSDEDAIRPEQATAIAQLARRAAEHFGKPQDVEWAFAGGELFLLQSRPMTALPTPIEWRPPQVRGLHPPGPSYWMRNLRLGEWLPEPVTPLFENWMLRLINTGVARGSRADSGISAGLRHAIVNCWYYSTAEPDLRAGALLRGILTRPLTVFRFASSIIKQPTRPEIAERRFFGRVVRRWHEETLPGYRALIAECTARLDSAPLAEIPAIIDRAGEAAGDAFWALAIGGGSAWKIEVALARFYREHLAALVQIDVQVLLAGLQPPQGGEGPHAVLSADWYRPTLGESGISTSTEERRRRRTQLEERRKSAEDACRNALEGKPRLRRRFDVLLEIAQRYAQLREEQAGWFTLAWPLLRRCVLLLGGEAVARGAVDSEEDAFFLTRGELIAAATGIADVKLRDRVRDRRAEWERSSRMVAPLALGEMPKLLKRALESLEVLRSARPAPDDALRGEPASPGRASGPVRVVRGAGDFDRFRPGEVLVAQVTAPAWTPLFARAAAVVTDAGSLAAHASLVAREYGIPAVVATGDATARLAAGEWVTVDGSAGLVEVQHREQVASSDTAEMVEDYGAPAAAAGRITLDARMTVNRMGFGAMRLTGPGIWGEPQDPEECRNVLRRALELGIDLIDTADSYGPSVSERLIAETLRPYPPGLVIATKGGLVRPGPSQWMPNGRPEHLRAGLEGSLRRLGVDQVDLYQLHRPDPEVPFEESLGTLINLKEQGKIRAIGLSNVSEQQLQTALGMTSIASVQNRYNLVDRDSEGVLRMCEEHGIAFIPWAPIMIGDPGADDTVERIARERGISVRQLALAWILGRSSQTLPIPGTATVTHLEENVAAAAVRLTPQEVQELEATYGVS